MSDRKIITISREYGCMGIEIAKKLADMLGYKYYDKEIIKIASEKSGISEERFENAENKPTNSLLYSLVLGMYQTPGQFEEYQNFLSDDSIFNIQSDIIRSVALKESCVIVGRCADYVLRDEENVFNIFLKSSEENRVNHVLSETKGANINEIKKQVRRADKNRRTYYEYYTGRKWANANNYDLCIDSLKFGVDKCCKLIIDLISK